MTKMQVRKWEDRTQRLGVWMEVGMLLAMIAFFAWLVREMLTEVPL